MIHFEHHHYPRVAEVTSYCLLGKMRNGRYVHPHAAASIFLPRGTKVTFKRHVVGGLRKVKIEDTGNLGPRQIDVWQRNCNLAMAWGRRHVRYRLGW